MGFCATGNGYGWCAQASNVRRSFFAWEATPFMNVAGATVSVRPFFGWSRPCDDVSPIATSADLLPCLIPVYPALARRA